jgi:hypothetical protein
MSKYLRIFGYYLFVNFIGNIFAMLYFHFNGEIRFHVEESNFEIFLAYLIGYTSLLVMCFVYYLPIAITHILIIKYSSFKSFTKILSSFLIIIFYVLYLYTDLIIIVTDSIFFAHLITSVLMIFIFKKPNVPN